MNLSLPTGLSCTTDRVGTITNDDILVTIDPATATVEGDPAVLTLTIQPAIHPPFDLVLDTSGLTATGGIDYLEVTNQLIVVPANATTVPAVILTTEDAQVRAT